MREIAKEVHMSFSDIGAIFKREFGTEEDAHESKDVQAFELFAKGLKPLDVIMKLNMQVDQVKRLYTEYQSLRGLDVINDIFKELGDDTEQFFQLYKNMKEQGFGPEEIAKAAKAGNDLPILELRHENLKDEVERIENKNQNLISEKESLDNVIAVSKTIMANLDQLIEKRTHESKSLDSKQQMLVDGILRLMGSKEYRKIKEIAREQAETILKDKKGLLAVTLFAILEAMKLDPGKQILLSDVQNFNGNQSYHIELQKKELIELAEQLHDKLANELVNTTMNSVFS